MNAPARERLWGLSRPTLQALRAELGPRFVNEQQRTFFDSQAPEVLYSGAFRAGKSRIGCAKGTGKRMNDEAEEEQHRRILESE